MPILDKIDPPVVEPDNVQPQPRNSPDKAPVVTGDTARQGPPGSRVLYVLVIGIVGAIVLMLGIYGFWHGS